MVVKFKWLVHLIARLLYRDFCKNYTEETNIVEIEFGIFTFDIVFDRFVKKVEYNIQGKSKVLDEI